MSDRQKILFLETLDPKLESDWLDYWQTHEHTSWRQHPACGDLGTLHGARVVHVVGLKNGTIGLVGVFSYRSIGLGMGATEAICLRGPVFDDVSFAQWCLPQIESYFRSHKVGTVRIGPYWRFPEAEELERILLGMGYVALEKDRPRGRRMTGIIDIRKDNQDILKGFDHGTRRQIKGAEKHSIEFRIASSLSEAEEFFCHLDKRDKQRGISRISWTEFQAMFRVIAATNGIGAIINAYHDNTFLGGLLIVRGGKTSSMSKFVVSDKSRHMFPTLRIAPSLFFRGMLWAKSQGCEINDLEGYSTNDDGPADQAFINRYKTGFNPLPCEALGQYYAVCNRTMFRIQRLLILGRRTIQMPQRLVYRVLFEFKKWRVMRREGKPIA